MLRHPCSDTDVAAASILLSVLLQRRMVDKKTTLLRKRKSTYVCIHLEKQIRNKHIEKGV